MKKLRFLAVEHVDVPLPAAVRIGKRHVIGKRPNEQGKMFPMNGPDEIVLTASDMSDKSYFRQHVLDGELRCADEETAMFLKVPFEQGVEQ